LHGRCCQKPKILINEREEKMKVYFVRTCYACPEQYDVYTESKEQIGYVRLRYGILKAVYPDFGGEKVFEYIFEGDDLKGFFDNDDERNEMLGIIATILVNKHTGSEDGRHDFEIVKSDWLGE